MHLLLCTMFTCCTGSQYCNFLLHFLGLLCVLSRAVGTLPIRCGVLYITTLGGHGAFLASHMHAAHAYVQVMAAWILQHYQDVLGSPSKVAYIELGPGNGTLAKQILSALTMMHGGNALLKAMRMHMVEVSPGLRAAQAEALHCRDTVTVAEVRSPFF